MKSRIMSFIKKTTSRNSNPKKHGTARGRLSSSYSIYENCEQCPLKVYISLVCDDDLKSLVMEGEPSDDALREAKMNIISEFAELSGNEESDRYLTSLCEIHLLRSQILTYSTIINYLTLSPNDIEFSVLKDAGLPSNVVNGDLQKSIKYVRSKLKNMEVRLQEKLTQLSRKETGKTSFTESDFNEQLVQVSKHAGFRITKEISAAEYASYLKDLRKTIDYGNKHK